MKKTLSGECKNKFLTFKKEINYYLNESNNDVFQ